jgi:hypothetical protein
MKKLVVSSFVSLDGVIVTPMTWASQNFDDECRQFARQKLDNVEYFLPGRVAWCVPRSKATLTGAALTG